jgi:hypothetical protein
MKKPMNAPPVTAIGAVSFASKTRKSIGSTTSQA